MKKSHLLIIAILLGMTIILSACVPGPRVTGSPGISLTDDVAVVSYSNFVYGLNLTNGSVSWSYPESANNQVVFYAPPLISEGYVYVGDLANNFHKIDLQSGQVIWTFSGGRGYYIGKAAIGDGVVYAPSNDGKLYAIDNSGSLLWEFKTGHYLWAQPQVAGDRVLVGSMDHFIYAISLEGEELWSAEMAGAVGNSPVLNEDGSLVFVGSLGGDMIAFDTLSGDRLWTLEAEASVWGTPILVDGILKFSDSTGNIYAVDAESGENIWQTEILGNVVGGLTAIPDGFVLATEAGVVKAFNQDGSPKWEATLDGEIFQAPVVNDDYLIVGAVGGDNLVYCLSLSGVQLWSTTPGK